VRLIEIALAISGLQDLNATTTTSTTTTLQVSQRPLFAAQSIAKRRGEKKSSEILFRRPRIQL
jgi:hypothetical protein